jgi:hypothetical protein
LAFVLSAIDCPNAYPEPPGACAGHCSQAVAALISLASPLPYSADFRPYFTIHDCDFKGMSEGSLPSNSNALPRMLGITNLYFLKARIECALLLVCAQVDAVPLGHGLGGQGRNVEIPSLAAHACLAELPLTARPPLRLL